MGGSITLPGYFQFSPFMIAQSGQPYNITTGSDNNQDTFYNDRPDLVTGMAPNGTTIKSIAGCGTFAQPGVVARSAGGADQLLHGAGGVYVQLPADEDVGIWSEDRARRRREWAGWWTWGAPPRRA